MVATFPVPYPSGLELPPEVVEVSAIEEGASRLRFSLAGVQLKFSALKHKDRGGGLTIPAQGVGGHRIVKPPSTQYPGMPENEFPYFANCKCGLQNTR